GDGDGSISVIDGETNVLLQTVQISNTSSLTDIAAAHDGAKVFAALRDGTIAAMDTTTFALSGPYPVPTSTGGPASPTAIDVSADGASVFVLESNYSSVEKLSAADGSSQGRAAVSSNARELKLSSDGLTLVVVGGDPAQFF